MERTPETASVGDVDVVGRLYMAITNKELAMLDDLMERAGLRCRACGNVWDEIVPIEDGSCMCPSCKDNE